jgi:hypothetical protein
VSFWRAFLVVLFATTVSAGQSQRGKAKHTCVSSPSAINIKTFRNVMETVAEGRNHGNARLASSCFTENAVFSDHPQRPISVGKNCLNGLAERQEESCRCI